MDTTFSKIDIEKYRLTDEQINEMTADELDQHRIKITEARDEFVKDFEKSFLEYLLETFGKDIKKGNKQRLFVSFKPEYDTVIEIADTDPNMTRRKCICREDYKSIIIIRDCFGGPYSGRRFDRKAKPEDYKLYTLTNIYMRGVCLSDDEPFKSKNNADKQTSIYLAKIMSALTENNEVRKFVNDNVMTAVESYEEMKKLGREIYNLSYDKYQKENNNQAK